MAIEARAKAKFLRLSPRKARVVVDLVRGKRVPEALAVLSLCRKAAAKPVKAVIQSAVANAAQGERVDEEMLRVKQAYVDPGPSLKRWRPRAMGRASRVLKRTSHVTVVVEEI
jgi:large subunit ribosomal protein L22